MLGLGRFQILAVRGQSHACTFQVNMAGVLCFSYQSLRDQAINVVLKIDGFYEKFPADVVGGDLLAPDEVSNRPERQPQDRGGALEVHQQRLCGRNCSYF
jgi:hypothetical protein